MERSQSSHPRESPPKTARSKGAPWDFPRAIRQFLGHLEGVGKASSSLSTYKVDLGAFQKFLARGLGSRPVTLSKITRSDLEQYSAWLIKQGHRPNTRRRRLLVARRFLNFLHQRKRLGFEVGRRIPTPARVERIPHTTDARELVSRIRALSTSSEIERRDQVLLWLLTETGCATSEPRRLRAEHFAISAAGTPEVRITAKTPRSVPISRELHEAVLDLIRIQSERVKKSPWLFEGFNRFGPMSGAMTGRAVELLVRDYSGHLGEPRLVPRMIRHSVVMEWARQGIPQDEMQRRLGLRSRYAFRTYGPMIEARYPANTQSTSK
jgi:site-specific recombinase XerD